ncbi:MAG: hypothetical protein AAGD01_01470 [Acidobacteriota bacterium]
MPPRHTHPVMSQLQRPQLQRPQLQRPQLQRAHSSRTQTRSLGAIILGSLLSLAFCTSLAAAERASTPGKILLIYLDTTSGNGDLYAIDAVNPEAQPQRVTNSELAEGAPRWDAAGQRVVFARSGPDDEPQRFLVPLTGDSPQESKSSEGALLINPAGDEVPSWAPVVSPKGFAIAYSAVVGDNADLYLAQGDGTSPKRLTEHPGRDIQPVFSPDGSLLAFTSDRSGNSEVWVLDPWDPESEAVNVTSHPAQEGHPAWFPDGEHLLVYSSRSGGADLYRVALPAALRSDASSPEPKRDEEALALTVGDDLELLGSISPDGRWLAFGSSRGGDWNLWLQELGTDGAPQGQARALTSSKGFQGDPHWIPASALR